MSRLVIVSNRVALPGVASAGGLAMALQGGDGGNRRALVRLERQHRPAESGRLHEAAGRQHPLHHRRPFASSDRDDYYNGFANRTLWPLLHFRMDLVDYSRETYAGYRASTHCSPRSSRRCCRKTT